MVWVSLSFRQMKMDHSSQLYQNFHSSILIKEVLSSLSEKPSSSDFSKSNLEMKRTADEDPNHPVTEEEDERLKKRKNKLEEEDDDNEIGFVKLNDDLAFEVLKHFDAKSLATAACVNKRWSKMAEDERLWEIICTRHWQNIGCSNRQLRSVVLALGGFRRLHSLYIWPLLKNSSSSSSSSIASSSSTAIVKPKPNWGKDEVNLSLSLLSIRYYEMMMKRKTSN